MTAFILDGDEEASHLVDWRIPVVFNCRRHLEKVDETSSESETWRLKERMKTVSVALVLCLNVGVDPPDIIKIQPCARLECWIDPLAIAPQKALEQIAANLQKQYEKWQPRARYKHSLDPTVDEVKRLCTSLRRNAKDEHVLFHYNGHGVPKPTNNGEIWVFNKTYTQYIPLSIYDLQQWMGCPSIYVYDCSCAGLIVESFKQFAAQHAREHEMFVNNSKAQNDVVSGPPAFGSCIQLAACGATQILPMNPELPADLFTCCLTTPVKTALIWFVLQNGRKLVPEVTVADIDNIPGLLNDRRTMLGELNWIFTAITDTIAWNILPKDMFQRLFRQDLLVASLFRNFLLSERIMRSYNCIPVSDPPLPPTHHHPMWKAWDLAVDVCLSQIPHVRKDPIHGYCQSPFFSEQLTAFQVWLSHGLNGQSIPEQLPIVLQVLLSQAHRLRALELLGKFLDLGPWAVNLALSVGIFPYVLKLLQSSARELRPLLVFIWAKVLAVDSTCQNDLIRDGGYKYFLCILGDPYMPSDYRTMAAFAVAIIVKDNPNGKLAALQDNVIAICLEQLFDPYPKLRQWVAICLGCIWSNLEQARWCGVRDSAHEKLYTLLSDPEPEVRACAVFALGTFLNSTTERTDHANAIDHNIAMTLLNKTATDGSPLVRMELIIALQWFLLIFENQFIAVAYQYMEEEKLKEAQFNQLVVPSMDTPTGMKKVASRDRLKPLLSSSPVSGALDNSGDGIALLQLEKMRRVSSSTSLCSLSGVTVHSPTLFGSCVAGYASVFTCIWRALIAAVGDPYPDVARLSNILIDSIKEKVQKIHGIDVTKPKRNSSSVSEPSSPSGKADFLGEDFQANRQHAETNLENRMDNSKMPKGLQRWGDGSPVYHQYQYYAQFHRIRKTFDKGPDVIIKENTEEHEEPKHIDPKLPIIESSLMRWCTNQFCEPISKNGNDPESEAHHIREWKYLRNESVRRECLDDQKRINENSRFDEKVFASKSINLPNIVKFHPFDVHIIVADKESYSMWECDTGIQLTCNTAQNSPNVKITALEFLNAHDDTLLLTGSDDGSVKVWQQYTGDAQLVTAFQILHELRSVVKGSGLVLHWEQHSGQLLASGDSRLIRVWDANKEDKIVDIPTGSENCVTSISSHPNSPNLIVAGCGDGTVRSYDRRLPPSESILKVYQEHSGWVVNVSLKSESSTDCQIISGCVAGDVRFWDLRQPTSTSHIPPSHGMTAMAVHPRMDLIACGAASQFVSVYNKHGDIVSTIKYHDGFMGHRFGPVSCLNFHPYLACLAAGSTDCSISIYSVNRR